MYLVFVEVFCMFIGSLDQPFTKTTAMKQHALFILLFTSPLFLFAKPAILEEAEKTGANIVYIDVPIHQPNVEDCYDDETYVTELFDRDWVRVYPNPNQGHFNVEVNHLKPDEGVTISIFNLTGKQHYITRVDKHGHEITKELNLSSLPKGVYFIHIQVNMDNSVQRVIIF